MGTSRHHNTANQPTMKSIIFACVVALATARPERLYESSAEPIAILRDVRVNPTADGQYSTDFETANGIIVSESGYGSGPDGAVESQGFVKFTHPNGEEYELKFVADAEGYKPDSAALPVAPAFPHPIPQFVLDQIAFAAQERANADSDESYA